MTYLVILGAYFAILFVAAWLSRRNLGVPTLALAAGVLLADAWASSLAPVVAQAGLVLTKPPLTSVVAVVLTLLPSLIVMVRAGRVSSRWHSVSGALVFAVFATILTYGAFHAAVEMDDASRQYAAYITQYRHTIITTCIVYAIVEISFRRQPHASVADKKKK